MIIIVCWKNGKPFKINIDEKKNTILDLKKKIAEHYNWESTNFNILNKNDIIDDTKNYETIISCNLGRLIRLPTNYNPGDIYYYLIII